MATRPGRRVAIVAGLRTPFVKSGTAFKDLSALELGKQVVAELVQRAIAEYSTGLSMGESAEKMAKENGISREAQDQWAHRSHTLAAQAWAEGKFSKEVMRVLTGEDFATVVAEDNIVRKDSKLEG